MIDFPTAPHAALEALLEGRRLSIEDLRALIAANEAEGQHLEYKDGALLRQSEKSAKATIRRVVAAFANSLGVLWSSGSAPAGSAA